MSGLLFWLPVAKMSWEKNCRKKPILLVNFCFLIHFDFSNARIFSFSIGGKVMNPKIPLCKVSIANFSPFKVLWIIKIFQIFGFESFGIWFAISIYGHLIQYNNWYLFTLWPGLCLLDAHVAVDGQEQGLVLPHWSAVAVQLGCVLPGEVHHGKYFLKWQIFSENRWEVNHVTSYKSWLKLQILGMFQCLLLKAFQKTAAHQSNAGMIP